MTDARSEGEGHRRHAVFITLVTGPMAFFAVTQHYAGLFTATFATLLVVAVLSAGAHEKWGKARVADE